MANSMLNIIRESLINAGVDKKLANSVKFPSGLKIKEIDKKVVLMLSDKAIGVCKDSKSCLNMQNNEAAFEGWAFLVYVHYAKAKGYTVELSLIDDKNNNTYEKIEQIYKSRKTYKYTGFRLHHNRFLYRALRFSQQYKEWFALSDKLKPYVKNFENFLSNTEEGFTNNIPNDEKTSKDFLYTDKIRENDVEDIFADSDWQQNQGSMFCKKYGGTLFRQLPVCLFEGDKANNSKAVFTGKKSAIDLWSCNKGEINIFELKFDNKMIGIITELFFYTNFLRDMFCRGRAINFNCQKLPSNSKDVRGYKHIEKANFTNVNGYMLYDKGNLHQAITDNIIAEMNNAFFGDSPKHIITYGKVEYKVSVIVC